MTQQLHTPIPVTVTSDRLPEGVRAQSRKGWCYAWKDTGIDGHRLWICVMDETGEVVDVPQPEVRVDANWSMGRRPAAPVSGTDPREPFALLRVNIGSLHCPECGVKPGHVHLSNCPQNGGVA